MRISIELIIGLALTLISAYYWSAFGHSPFSEVPSFYRYSFRLFPYLDIIITALGMMLFYRGLKKMRK